MVNYLDFVGKMHTPKTGSAELNVPLVQMNALLGFVADALTATLFSLGLDRDTRDAHGGFCKLLWLQNDLINRHYQIRDDGLVSGERTHCTTHELRLFVILTK